MVSLLMISSSPQGGGGVDTWIITSLLGIVSGIGHLLMIYHHARLWSGSSSYNTASFSMELREFSNDISGWNKDLGMRIK
jgi:hypothetical protein